MKRYFDSSLISRSLVLFTTSYNYFFKNFHCFGDPTKHYIVLFGNRDFMDVNMDRTKHILNYLYPIVGRASPKLRQFMEEWVSYSLFLACLTSQIHSFYDLLKVS